MVGVQTAPLRVGATEVNDEIVEAAFAAFRNEMEAIPTVTLRGGDALDSYTEPPPYDPDIDAPTDAYLEAFGYHGLPFLDPESWRHYVPRLIDYALRNLDNRTSMVTDGLIFSFRPPDREPPRLGSLSPEQEAVVVAFLERLAYGDEGVHDRQMAQQALNEWWVPDALYRPRRHDQT